MFELCGYPVLYVGDVLYVHLQDNVSLLCPLFSPYLTHIYSTEYLLREVNNSCHPSNQFD